MSDPADLAAIDVLSGLLPKPIDVAVVSDTQLIQAYDNFYRRTEEIASFAQVLAEEYQNEAEFDFDSGVNFDIMRHFGKEKIIFAYPKHSVVLNKSSE